MYLIKWSPKRALKKSFALAKIEPSFIVVPIGDASSSPKASSMVNSDWELSVFLVVLILDSFLTSDWQRSYDPEK